MYTNIILVICDELLQLKLQPASYTLRTLIKNIEKASQTTYIGLYWRVPDVEGDPSALFALETTASEGA